MSLKAVFNSVSEIPENFRELYAETSPGCWTLTGIEGVHTEKEWNELRNSMSVKLESAEKVNGICRKLGISPDEIETLSNGYSELKSRWEKTDSDYKRTLICSALKDAAIEAGVRPEALSDVLARAPLFRVAEDSTVATGEELGSLSPKEWIGKQIQESPHWLSPSRSAGIRQTSFHRASPTRKLSMADLVSDAWNNTRKGK